MSNQFCYFCKREKADHQCETCKRMVCHQCAGPYNHNCYPREGRSSRNLLAAGILAASLVGVAALASESSANIEKIYSKPGTYDGPVWDPLHEQLLFTRYSGSSGKILRWKPGTQVVPWSSQDFVIAGLKRGNDGYLVGADFIHHSLVRIYAGRDQIQSMKPMAGTSEDGKFAEPNDLSVGSNGWIYVTDPDFKHRERSAVWGVSPTGNRKKMISDLEQPNGIAVTPDARTLFVSDSYDKKVYRYKVLPSGDVDGGSKKLFFNPPGHGSGDMDGIELDSSGNLLVVARNSVWAVDSNGNVVGEQNMHANCTNITVGFVGADAAFVTCENAVYRVKLPLASP